MRRLMAIFLLTNLSVSAQTDPAFPLEDTFRSGAEGAEEFDFNTLFEERRRALNLNTATEWDLRASGLFDEAHIRELLRYREIAGPLLALYELQAIPGFDLPFIKSMLPFVSVGAGLDDFNVRPRALITGGSNELFLRWRRLAEPKKGDFAGDANQYYMRFRHAYENRFSFGFTAEKDPGEAFFRGSNPLGFDFYSFHVFLRNYNRLLKAAALGDFSVALGQGLILNNGFAYGKSPASMDIRRGGRTLSPFTSVNESIFFRGAAATLGLGRRWELTFFQSSRLRDGNLQQGENGPFISSMLLSGLHRTPLEISRKRNFRQTTLGGSLKWLSPKGHLAANAVYDRLSVPWLRTPQPYNVHYFRGNKLLNASLDYAWRHRNFHFFGETALSGNGALANVHGVLAALDRKADISLLYRDYSPRFQTLHGTPFAETTGANNERGVYLGAEVRPLKGVRLNGYFDMWKHPWLRFQTNGPSAGHEWLLRVTLYKKRAWEGYWQIRGQTRENGSVRASRLHFSCNVNKALEWRARLETSQAGGLSGVMLYQDILYRPLGAPLSFTTRFALFDTGGYEVRFYAYENGMLYNFGIPAYYDRGSRFYLNIRYRGIRNLTLEGRYARSFFPGKQEIGSGPDATSGDTRTEWGAQVRWGF
jgi:hypothetical protein